MVNEIKKYKCSICNKVHDDIESANRCESKGIIKLHPIGTVYSMYKEPNMVFAVIKQHPNNNGHHHSYLTWACRDTPTGDNCSGEEFCGFESWTEIYPPNKESPAYTRMLEALENEGIDPIDYNTIVD